MKRQKNYKSLVIFAIIYFIYAMLWHLLWIIAPYIDPPKPDTFLGHEIIISDLEYIIGLIRLFNLHLIPFFLIHIWKNKKNTIMQLLCTVIITSILILLVQDQFSIFFNYGTELYVEIKFFLFILSCNIIAFLVSCLLKKIGELQ